MRAFLNSLRGRSGMVGVSVALGATTLGASSMGMFPSASGEQAPHPSALASREAEEASVRALVTQMSDAWNRGDGIAAAALFAEDGELVSAAGTYWNGQAEIAKYLTHLLTGPLKGSRYIATVTSVRFLRQGVALMHLGADFVPLGATEPAPERRAVQSIVAVRDAGKWRVALFQATRTPPSSAEPAR